MIIDRYEVVFLDTPQYYLNLGQCYLKKNNCDLKKNSKIGNGIL